MPRDCSSILKGVWPMKNLRAGLAGLAIFALMLFLTPGAFATVAGTISRWSGNELQFQGSSGSNGFSFKTDGLRGLFSSCADCFIAGDSTHLIVGTSTGIGYVASGTPGTLDSVYVNTIPSAFTYGGGTLPAHPFTVQGIKFYVRTAGSGGTTNATFQVSDGTNTCNCTYACNQTTGGKRAACANGAGTGCVYAVSAVLTYAFTGVGDCAATSADIEGNISVEGIWQ